MRLPMTIGITVKVLTPASELRHWLEWQGFVIASGTMQYHTMRRDFHAGFFKGPEPQCPHTAVGVIKILRAERDRYAPAPDPT